MSRLDDHLAALATMSPAQLREAWQDAFDDAPPAVSPSLLRYGLAYRLQEQAFGGLPAATGRILDGMRSSSTSTLIEPVIRLKPGTRLLREWNGILYAVLVTGDGLLFQDRRFASLSQIATEITGAHWSGPRFFGLKRPVNPPRQGVAVDG